MSGKPNLVNGRHYPLWSQFVENKQRWIGGTLFDTEYPEDGLKTEIIDVVLRPSDGDSALFEFIGKDFTCGFDVRHGGIGGIPIEEGWLPFSGPYGLSFQVKERMGNE